MANTVKPQADNQQPDSIVEQRAHKADQKIQNLINMNRSKEDKDYRKRHRADLAAGKSDTWELINDPVKAQKYGEQQPANGQFVANGNAPNSLKNGLYESKDYPGTIFKVEEDESFKMIANPTPEALINFADVKGMTSIEVDADVPQNANGDWLEEWWQAALAAKALHNLEVAMKQGQAKGIEVTIGSGLKGLIDKHPELAIKFDALQKANQAAHKEAKQLYPLKKSARFNDLAQGLRDLSADIKTAEQIRTNNSGKTLDEKMQYLQERIGKKKTQQDLINTSCKLLSDDAKDTRLVEAEKNDPNPKFTDKVKKIRMTCKDSREDLTDSLMQSQEDVKKELAALKDILMELKEEAKKDPDPAKIAEVDKLEKQINQLQKEDKFADIGFLQKEAHALDELLKISTIPVPEDESPKPRVR